MLYCIFDFAEAKDRFEEYAVYAFNETMRLAATWKMPAEEQLIDARFLASSSAVRTNE